ncbi:LAME_0B07580g1_1 [Lachancea meyersii CBS 8951]|uniref:LAME_0B07580g1_1 n=1 Tax=Lachancea meyersii CBS 8951 TaxID=1266667 RepID=A0A1G4IX65_9SACH|nr:LAME_0B07580g1_1 [Lachancea meyersii CBS 8951]
MVQKHEQKPGCRSYEWYHALICICACAFAVCRLLLVLVTGFVEVVSLPSCLDRKRTQVRNRETLLGLLRNINFLTFGYSRGLLLGTDVPNEAGDQERAREKSDDVILKGRTAVGKWSGDYHVVMWGGRMGGWKDRRKTGRKPPWLEAGD